MAVSRQNKHRQQPYTQYPIHNTQYNFGRIGVLMGGPSTEREISLKSGKAVCEALRHSGLEAVSIDIKTDNAKKNIRLLEAQKIACVFIALHGRFGEDGTIQAILEKLKIPYTGSRVKASALAMDKIASLKIFAQGGLRVPSYSVVEKNTNWKLPSDLAFPLVIKPATHGSSIGLSIIDREPDLEKAVNFAFSFDRRVIIEEYILGRELTVGILDEKALPVIEIIPKRRFFDFEAKYRAGLTEYVVPAQLVEGLARKAQLAGLLAHRLLGCAGCSRADMILDKNNLIYLLEVNTIPGLTSMSLLPKAARAAGIEFNELCITLLKLAHEKK